MGVDIPFNGVFPKGEVGINPASPNMRYHVYKGKVKRVDGFLYIEKGEKLDVSIEPKLIDLRYSCMHYKPEHLFGDCEQKEE